MELYLVSDPCGAIVQLLSKWLPNFVRYRRRPSGRGLSRLGGLYLVTTAPLHTYIHTYMTVPVTTMRDRLFPTRCSHIVSRADNLLPRHAAEETDIMWLYGVGGSRMWESSMPNRCGCLWMAWQGLGRLKNARGLHFACLGFS